VAPLSAEHAPLLRVPVLTNSAANLIERVARRQAFERGAELRDDGVESFDLARRVDDHRETEGPVDDQRRISGMKPQRLDFGFELTKRPLELCFVYT
jgi:hypothetical protein